MKEYEVKIPVKDLEEVEEVLKGRGWSVIGHFREVDHYIDLRRCVGIPAERIAFRVRERCDLASGRCAGEVTYKGEPIESDVKAREEVSVGVDDPGKLAEVFLRLGFELYRVSKVRKVMDSGGDVRIYLDEVEGLGRFIEVEMMNPPSKEEYFRRLNEVKEMLGLAGEENITLSYLELSLRRLKK